MSNNTIKQQLWMVKGQCLKTNGVLKNTMKKNVSYSNLQLRLDPQSTQLDM